MIIYGADVFFCQFEKKRQSIGVQLREIKASGQKIAFQILWPEELFPKKLPMIGRFTKKEAEHWRSASRNKSFRTKNCFSNFMVRRVISEEAAKVLRLQKKLMEETK